MPFILGTAGHIDHGKTTLVQALTGINCDRLEEERKRGITIELGFAWLDLPDGQRLGIVDVPGHERFVKNMVAGAAGIDLVLLVIAADEGVMPQTREHLDICSLLGIRQGLVVLTKCDLVDGDWLNLVREDVAGFLQGTFLEGCPILPVSATTGEGLPELRQVIARLVHGLQPQTRSDIFRLPVDRIFSMKGFGTIVTGTVFSGHLEKDQDAVIMPAGLATHVRNLQRHGQPTDEALAGERCAANLQGLEVTDIHRGDMLALPGTLFPSPRWLVRLSCLESSPIALRHRTELHFHHGTLETLARIHLFDSNQLAPGEQALAELRFDTPLPGVFGDHCVLRSASPLRAVAGGILVSPLPPALRSKDPARNDKLALLTRLPELAAARTGNSDAELVAAVLALREAEGAPLPVLRVLTGLSRKRLDKALQLLASRHDILCYDRDASAWIEKSAFAGLCRAALARAEDLHEKSPLRSGFARAALEGDWSRGLAPRLVARVLDALVQEGHLIADQDSVRLAGHSIVLDARQQKIRDAVLASHRKAGLTPPNMKDVLADLGIGDREATPVLNLLLTEGDLVRVREGLYYAREALDDILDRVAAWFGSHDDLTLADMRDLLGLSRKYLIALLEYFDQERITVRIGDKRQFRTSREREAR